MSLYVRLYHQSSGRGDYSLHAKYVHSICKSHMLSKFYLHAFVAHALPTLS